jgi:hypothetical protein
VIELAAAALEVREGDLATKGVAEDAVDGEAQVGAEAEEIVGRAAQGVRGRRALREAVLAQVDEDHAPARVREGEAAGEGAEVRAGAEDAVEEQQVTRGARAGRGDQSVVREEGRGGHRAGLVAPGLAAVREGRDGDGDGDMVRRHAYPGALRERVPKGRRSLRVSLCLDRGHGAALGDRLAGAGAHGALLRPRHSQPRFHVVVVGASGTGRTFCARSVAKRIARERPTPDDMLLMPNPRRPSEPTVLSLPRARGGPSSTRWKSSTPS